MKIALFSLSQISCGKCNVKDERLDEVDKITGSKKKTYLQVELISEDAVLEADALLIAAESRADLILKDLEFVETRLSRTEDEKEKTLLNKLKSILEKEEFIFKAELGPEEKQALSQYGLFTNKPVIAAGQDELEDINGLLARAVKEGGYISFFTTGEKETRSWLIRQGTTAWEAAGVIHSDIQRGFIRAEIIAYQDFVQAGGETAAKQQGKLRLEQKNYLMQDADLVNFRFNK